MHVYSLQRTLRPIVRTQRVYDVKQTLTWTKSIAIGYNQLEHSILIIGGSLTPCSPTDYLYTINTIFKSMQKNL